MILPDDCCSCSAFLSCGQNGFARVACRCCAQQLGIPASKSEKLVTSAAALRSKAAALFLSIISAINCVGASVVAVWSESPASAVCAADLAAEAALLSNLFAGCTSEPTVAPKNLFKLDCAIKYGSRKGGRLRQPRTPARFWEEAQRGCGGRGGLVFWGGGVYQHYSTDFVFREGIGRVCHTRCGRAAAWRQTTHSAR